MTKVARENDAIYGEVQEKYLEKFKDNPMDNFTKYDIIRPIRISGYKLHHAFVDGEGVREQIIEVMASCLWVLKAIGKEKEGEDSKDFG